MNKSVIHFKNIDLVRAGHITVTCIPLSLATTLARASKKSTKEDPNK